MQQPPQGYGPPPAAPATPWYQSSVIIAASLFCCWPVGLILLWTSKTISTTTKLVGTAVFGLLGIIGAASFFGSAAARSHATSAAGASPYPTGAAAQRRAETATPEPAEQARAIPLKTLLSEYKDNEVRADQQFKDQLISTTGKVGDIKKDIMNHIYVIVGTGAMFEIPTVQCFPSDGQEGKAAALSKGDTVTVEGRVSGLMMNVLVKDCQIVSSK